LRNLRSDPILSEPNSIDHGKPFDPQTSAAWPRTSSDVQFSLEIRVLELGAFRRIKAMVVKMTVRPIAKLSE